MNVMKKNKLAGKFSLLHRLNTDTVIIGLLPGINVNELTSTDLRYLAAFYLGGAVYRNSMVNIKSWELLLLMNSTDLVFHRGHLYRTRGRGRTLLQ